MNWISYTAVSSHPVEFCAVPRRQIGLIIMTKRQAADSRENRRPPPPQQQQHHHQLLRAQTAQCDKGKASKFKRSSSNLEQDGASTAILLLACIALAPPS
ncbi:uncharacterized protein LOC127795653 [Diospyros lotus]|uniref:uncharacterized protein LOC127795653 n=1 Tax=Diospyros lotus TaxID=55363 RepID=UPI00225BF15A|nr:uncharacterized protein LOC127795653 [Diospyros lotus]